jgi:3-phenylpropionate/trans-cinnamate dioxygenase ferredoxin subunit
MSYYKIMQADELIPGEKAIAEVNGKKVLLVNYEGTVYALDNRCPHLGGSLGDGILENEKIVCPRHGSMYDVRTGQNVGNAKIAFINIKVGPAKKYAVKVEDGNILIELD